MQVTIEDPLLRAVCDKVEAGGRLSFEDGLALYRSADLLAIGYLANLVRERLYGNLVYVLAEAPRAFPQCGTGEDLIEHLMGLRQTEDPATYFALSAGGLGFGDLKNVAIARLMLDKAAHVAASWTSLTPRVAQIALRFGADGIDRSDAPGARKLVLAAVEKAGRVAVECNSEYRPVVYTPLPLEVLA